MFTAHTNPTHSYDEALKRIEALQANEGAEINPLCRSELMSHGQATERVILFVHGYTNCPHQFHELGKLFFERGYNVFNARLPCHGLKDRLAKSLGDLTAHDLVEYVNEIVDIGHGLGDRLTLAGVSAGGVCAALAAQTRPEVDQAVIISPSFDPAGIPRWLTRPAINLASKLNLFVWWDFRAKANTPLTYAYPRFSTRSLGKIMQLGHQVIKAARTSKPQSRKLIVVTNAADPAVNNAAAYSLVESWEKHGATVVRFEFDARLKLLHDLIDPNQPNPRTDVVYPKLIELIDQ